MKRNFPDFNSDKANAKFLPMYNEMVVNMEKKRYHWLEKHLSSTILNVLYIKFSH